MTKRASTPGRRDENMPPREDAHASPLGRGADPGTAVETGMPRGQGIAGPRGANVPGETGGAAGLVERENEDAATTARRDASRLPDR